MSDDISKIISQAEARGEFINRERLDALSCLVRDGNKRLDIVDRITSNASTLVTNAARALFEEQPQLIASGGNAYTNRRMAACLRDMEIILRYVTYAVLAGDSSVLDDRCLNGLRETYQTLGVPGDSTAVAIQKMKDAAISIANDPNGVTPGDCSALMSELAGYFDRAAAVVVDINSGLAETVQEMPQSIDNSVIPAKETELDPPVGNLDHEAISLIDQKCISAWISEEADENQWMLTVGADYTLNLKVVQHDAASIPSTVLGELLPKKGIDTEWVVTSSTVKLAATTNDTSITTTDIDRKTVWRANFSLYIPVFGDSGVSQLQITPIVVENPSMLVLIYACGDIYRQFDIQFDVISSNSKIPPNVVNVA